MLSDIFHFPRPLTPYFRRPGITDFHFLCHSAANVETRVMLVAIFETSGTAGRKMLCCGQRFLLVAFDTRVRTFRGHTQFGDGRNGL